MRPGDAVDVAALERHLDGDHALRPHLDPRRGDVDLMGAGRRRRANRRRKQDRAGNDARTARRTLMGKLVTSLPPRLSGAR